MFINYNFLLKFNIFHDFFYRKKIEQNCAYIAKNKEKVLKKLKNESVLKVVFYVYDSCKWKCQTIYDEMLKNPRFEPLIIVTKNAAQNLDNPSYQTKEEILETFEFFKSKGMNVELGYDFDKNKYIPLKKFNPDIIIYQHPWYVETSQGPVVCSKFALTAYVPYDIPTTVLPSEYNLRFYQYVENFYVFNNELKEFYAPRMDNKGINLKAVGVPSLDMLTEQKNQKNYVIYAPHWTINHTNTIAYGTFTDNGQFILDYAKKHPEYNWIFKPHPMLKKAIIDNKFMSQEEVENYYSEWGKLGKACYDGDYFDIFNDSKLMITDCSTFLIEYLVTGNPIIRLVSKNAPDYNINAQIAVDNCYNSENNSDLEQILDTVLIKELDTMKENRIDAAKRFKANATENIIQDLLAQL